MCRALSESRLRAKLELSANRSGTFNECRSAAQHKFSCHAYEKMIQWIIFELKATEGIRTPDLLITNQLLYRLSHVGIAGEPARLIIIAQLSFYVY